MLISFQCLGCKTFKSDKRYICLTCRPGPIWKAKGFCDLCEDCFKKIQFREENREECLKVYY